MVQLQPSSKPEIIYPESDGRPMADNTQQFRWIVVIQQNLDWLFADQPNVLVVGDLLWYPVEGDNKISTAPDVMVIFGPAKGDRGSYQQWKEGNIPPQVVFEILSPGNTRTEMNRKLLFYNRFGVSEYYLYDPDKNELSGWLRQEDFLDVIESMEGWVSPQMQIRFDISGDELKIFRPDDQPFLSYAEIAQRAEEERQRADTAEAQLSEERRQREQLLAKLREQGIDPNEF